MDEKEIGALLERLGLTEYEGKTLGTLFKLGEAEAPAISRIAQVPKTRVYDVLDKLVGKNLVIEISGRPKRYRGIDAQDALNLLLEKKNSEVKTLQESVENAGVFGFGKGAVEAGETVMKVKDKRDFDRILAQEISKAKNSLLGFSELSEKEFVLRDAIEKAKQNKVKIKLINAFPNSWLKKNIETKQLDHGLNAYVIDGKRVVLALSDFKIDKPEYHFTIFHDKKPIANALQHYFDKCWK